MTEFLIIGAGPAGMSAALEAIRLGISPLVVDNRPEPGGNIYAYLGSNQSKINARMQIFGPDYAKGGQLLDAFWKAVESKELIYHSSTKLWKIDSDGTYAFEGPDGSQVGKAKQVLLATGAQERPMPIPGWTLPGVMGVGAAQILMKSGGELPDGDIVIVGAGPLPLLLADQLHKAGRPVLAVVEPKGASKLLNSIPHITGAIGAPKTSLKGVVLLAKRFYRRTPVWQGATDLSIQGDDHVTGLRFEAKGYNELNAAVVLIHDGIVPNLNPLRAASLDVTYSTQQQTWHAKSDGIIQVAGDGAGILGVEAAVISGRCAAASAFSSGPSKGDSRALEKLKAFRKFIDAAYPSVRLARTAIPETTLCRCELVTAKSVKEAVEIHGSDPNAIKRALRIGMGPCQGRMCAHSLADYIAEITHSTSNKVGLQKARTPILPVSFGVLADVKEVVSKKILTQ